MGDAHRVSNALTLKLFHDAVYYQHCNAPLVPISANIQRKQPGPKPKPLHERKTLSFKPVTRVERSYKHQKRVEVLLFLLNYRLTGTPGRGGPHRQGLPDSQDGFHPPTFFEASQFFKIPEATIKSWWKNGTSLCIRKINEGTNLNGQSWKTCSMPVFSHGVQRIELFLLAGFDENQGSYSEILILKAITLGIFYWLVQRLPTSA